MKTQDGFQQCYNAEIAVEEKSRLIVAAEVTQNAADNECLVPLTEAAEAQGGEKPERVLADAGYRSEESYTCKPRSSKMSYSGIQYMPVDCKATVCTPQFCNQSASRCRSAVKHSNRRTGCKSRSGRTAT